MMNWDAIGVIVEGIGAFAVVVSLFYLVIEVRRNTGAQNDANYAASVNLSKEFLEVLMADPDLALIWEKGLAGEDLTDAENARFRVTMWSYARSAQNIVYLAETGRFPSDEWDGFRESVLHTFNNEGGQRWWNEQKWRFSVRLRRMIDGDETTAT